MHTTFRVLSFAAGRSVLATCSTRPATVPALLVRSVTRETGPPRKDAGIAALVRAKEPGCPLFRAVASRLYWPRTVWVSEIFLSELSTVRGLGVNCPAAGGGRTCTPGSAAHAFAGAGPVGEAPEDR